MLVDQDDEHVPSARYSTPDLNDRLFDPAWCYSPDLMVLTTIDICRSRLGAGLDPAWQGCRDMTNTSGPWRPVTSTAMMGELPAPP
ncbi:hypothetical protein [Micromonospora noduli]|uniref:hypothetical protein n=1 Tax=Micromonospora noduli TaxID=709876 RepID=UPI0011BFE592|nr:hypothetical protein [Micromonospora noduli]